MVPLGGTKSDIHFWKAFTISKRIYVIAFAKVASSMIFQEGGVSKVFDPILHFQLIMNFYWPTRLGCGDLSSAK